jgi:uncharacterized protein (TIGR02118 family)
MVKIMIFIRKKAGLTREQFIHYYENNHVPLINRVIGPFPCDYRRSYPLDGQSFGLLGADAGNSAAPDCDVVTEIWLKDRETMDAMFARAADPEIAATIAADEENFADRSSVRIMIVEERT